MVSEMKILITGATGLVGSALAKTLQGAGHTICRLVRPGTTGSASAASTGFDVKWDPTTGELAGAAVGGDAVVNLAGASIAGGRWTTERKQLLRSSRIDSTRALVSAVAKMAIRPRVLVSASATGFYGDRGDDLLDESSASGTGFLSDIARDWEAEALKAESLGIRVALARFGIILSTHGGALPQMMHPFQFGLGGKLGSGQQWMSWITLQDVCGILQLAIENNAVRGPINVVSPQPVRNAEFTVALARAMHRPAIFAAPAFALRLALGEMADQLLLSSQRVQPAQLSRLGYKFVYPELQSALAEVLREN